MENDKLVEQSSAAGSLFGHLIGIGIVFLIAWIFDISAAKEYGWLAGLFHGAWVPYNWIMSLFGSDLLLKAPIHTTGYNIWWWIACISSTITFVFSGIILTIIKIRQLFK